MKHILLLLTLFFTGMLSAQSEYWKFVYKLDPASEREMKGISKESSGDFTIELYLEPHRSSVLVNMGFEDMDSRTVTDTLEGRKLVLSQFGEMKQYKLTDLEGNVLDETGAITERSREEQEPETAITEGTDFTLTGETKELKGMTLHKIEFLSKKTDKKGKAEGWIVFGKRLNGYRPMQLKDGRTAALVEMTAKWPDGGMTLELLEHTPDVQPGSDIFPVGIPEGYMKEETLSSLLRGGYEGVDEYEVKYYFDPEAYAPHLVPAASYPEVTADYWKVWTLTSAGKTVEEDELYLIPGKYRCEYALNGLTESVVVVDSAIYWQNKIDYRSENYSVSRLESYYDSPANTTGEQRPWDFYLNAARGQGEVWREGADFHLLPETRDAGGVTLLHVQLEQMAFGKVKGDGWLILRRLPFEEFPADEFILADGRKGYLVEHDYTYDKKVDYYGGSRYRMKVAHEPAKIISGKLFSLAPPEGFEDYKETYRVWKAADPEEEYADEDYEANDYEDYEAEPLFRKEDYAPYLKPQSSGEKVRADYWLVRDTDFIGDKEEFESYSIPGKFRSTHITYMESSNHTLVVDSTVYWENFMNNLEKSYSFARLENYYDSPANTRQEKKPDYFDVMRVEPYFLVEGEDFTVLPETRQLDGITLLHVKLHQDEYVEGEGWVILQYLPVFYYDDGLQFADGRIGYLLEFELKEIFSEEAQEVEEGEEEREPGWWKRQVIRHDEGKMVDGKVFSLSPPKGYWDTNE